MKEKKKKRTAKSHSYKAFLQSRSHRMYKTSCHGKPLEPGCVLLGVVFLLTSASATTNETVPDTAT